jgi:hypothetical protein
MSCNPGHGCWCSDLPHALPVPDHGTTACLCRDCLITKLNLQATPCHHHQRLRQSVSCPSCAERDRIVILAGAMQVVGLAEDRIPESLCAETDSAIDVEVAPRIDCRDRVGTERLG